MRSYNADVTLRLVLPLLMALALSACNRAAESKEAVREGIIDHLNKNSGLDVKSMDVVVDNVRFEGSRATARVSFKPKTSPDAGMSMNYTLERSGPKWVVQKAASGGHGNMAPPPAADPGALPPGHPPVAPAAPAK